MSDTSGKESVTFRHWLQNETTAVLKRNKATAPFIVWCDPDRVWRDLLLAASAGGALELWAEETHELILRERFAQAPRAPRVVWLPVAREEIGYFAVFALQAAQVWEETLPQALSRYGVNIPHERWHELAPLLPAYAKTWLDFPLDYWRKNFPGPLLDDDAILQVLAGVGRPLSDFVETSLTPIFYRRVTEDFGLPDARAMDLETWRARATAVLLTTDAAQQVPTQPPGDAGLIISDHAPRQQALKLLGQWQQRLDLLDAFEQLAQQADAVAGLGYWADQLPMLPASLASAAAERALWDAASRWFCHVHAAAWRTASDLCRSCRHFLGENGRQASALGLAGRSGGMGAAASRAQRARARLAQPARGHRLVYCGRVASGLCWRNTVPRRKRSARASIDCTQGPAVGLPAPS